METTRIKIIQKAILVFSVVLITLSNSIAEGREGDYLYVDQGFIGFKAESACALFFIEDKEPKSVCTSVVQGISPESKEFEDRVRASIAEDDRIKNLVAFPIPDFTGKGVRSKNAIVQENLHVLVLYHGSAGEISSSKIKKISVDAVFQNSNSEWESIKREQEAMELDRASLASRRQKRKEDILLSIQELLETRDAKEVLAILDQVSTKEISIMKLEQNIQDIESMIANYKVSQFLSRSNDKKRKGELSSMIRTLVEKSISR